MNTLKYNLHNMGFYKKLKTHEMSCVLDTNNTLSHPHKTHWK